MKAVEFNIELTGQRTLSIPEEAASQLPTSGVARVIVLPNGQMDDAQWRQGAYEQFLRDDSPDDAVYDTLR